jgi:hypothetical protein
VIEFYLPFQNIIEVIFALLIRHKGSICPIFLLSLVEVQWPSASESCHRPSAISQIAKCSSLQACSLACLAVGNMQTMLHIRLYYELLGCQLEASGRSFVRLLHEPWGIWIQVRSDETHISPSWLHHNYKRDTARDSTNVYHRMGSCKVMMDRSVQL